MPFVTQSVRSLKSARRVWLATFQTNRFAALSSVVVVPVVRIVPMSRRE